MQPVEIAKPLCDVLRDAPAAAALWPESADTLTRQIAARQSLAGAVRAGLDDAAAGRERPAVEAALTVLLRDAASRRLALYLPVQVLRPGSALSSAFLEAWDALLGVQDVRANFVDGDVVETRASAGAPERIVKAAHLAPLLVRQGVLDVQTLTRLLTEETDPVLCWSLADAADALGPLGLPVPPELQQARDALRRRLPARYHTPAPLFVTPAREAWLRQQAARGPRPERMPETDLSAPLCTRMETLAPECADAAALVRTLSRETTFGVVFLGGSRLKGYGRPDSDVDLCVLTRAGRLLDENGHATVSASVFEHPEMLAHAVFNTVWIGAPEDVAALRRSLVPRYFAERDPMRRAMTLERLEQDLLQYRLLHKGWQRLFPDTDPQYKRCASIDGASAFYETGYRVAAAKLFADAVFMPAI